MHDAVEPVDVLAQQVGQPLEVLLVGDVELEHRAGSGSRLTIRLVMPSARPKLEIRTVRALLLGDAGDREADRAVHRDAGDQDPLAVENAHAAPSVVELVGGGQ